MKKANRGFTLIEILVVIGMIAILAGIVLVALNPARQFAQARNTQRENDVNVILNAIGQNIADNKGVLTGCTGTAIGVATTSIGTGATNLSACLAPTYIASGVPKDPTGGTDADTGYKIVLTSGRYQICAPNHDENGTLNAGAYCLSR